MTGEPTDEQWQGWQDDLAADLRDALGSPS